MTTSVRHERPDDQSTGRAGDVGRNMKLRGAIAGVLSAGVALAIGELVAGIGHNQHAPVIAVGDLVIDNVPRPVKDLAIDLFGTNDKRALLIGIYAVITVLAALLGVAAVKRFRTGAI